MATLTVGASGAQFTKLAAAVAAASAGDTIDVAAGTYLNDTTYITKDLTITGTGGLAHFETNTNIGNGKAILVIDANVTLNNLELSGATVNDNNGAGIRYETGNLTINNSYIHNNQDGILGAASGTGTVTINNSEIAYNGIGDGYTHNIYVNEIHQLTINGSYIHDANVGHDVKSRADNTTITNSVLTQNSSNGSYVVDAPNGGNVLIQNTVLEKGPNAQGSVILHLGGEGGPYAGTNERLVNDTIINDQQLGYTSLVLNQAAAPVTISGGTVTGLANNTSVTQIDATVSGTAPATVAEPVINSTAPYLPLTGADRVVVTVSEDAAAGDAQFVVLVDGTRVGGVFTAGAADAVGARQAFTIGGNFGAGAHTVAVQYLNAAAGRALYVDGVTYDGATLNPAVAALTANGTASFTTGAAPKTTDTLSLTLAEDAYNGDALFRVTVDGQVAGPAQAVTASHAAGQTQTIKIAGNWGNGPHQVGVTFLNDLYAGPSFDRNLYVAGASYNGTAIANSVTELASNGTKTLAVPAKVAALAPPTAHTIAVALSEDAWQGDALAALTLDGTPLTGVVTVTASHGAGATQVLSFTGNYVGGPHTLGVSFLNDAWGGTAATDRNLYVGSVTVDGVAQANGVRPLYTTSTQNFNISVPNADGSVPAPTDDTLVLNLSEDAWQGDAKFIAYVDGVAMGPAQSVLASHAAGQTEAFTLKGHFGAGAHTLEVDFLNDAWGGTAATDRNLYIDNVQLNGTSYASATTIFRTTGASLPIGGTTDPAKNTAAIVPLHTA